MRILFFSSIFPRPAKPNAGIYCFHLCRALAAGGNAVRVVAPRSWLERGSVDPAAAGAVPGLADLRVDYPRYVYTPGVLRSAYAAMMWASAGGRLRRAIEEFNPTCVVSYWAHPDGAVAVRAAREAGVPSVAMVGGSDVLLMAKGGGLRGRQIFRALHAADAVVAVSRHMRDRLVESGVAAERVHVVYRGVDGNLFSPGDGVEARRRLGIPQAGKAIVFVGNLLPVKGLDVLLDAAARLRKGGAVFRLYLVGGGASRAELEAQRTVLGLDDVVTFVGPVPQHQLPDWYRAADLTVLPSRSEGIPNVLRESLACGTPFVATNVGGISEISDPAWSRLVPPGDPAALADALGAALAGPRPAPAYNTGTGWAESAEALLRVVRRAVEARGTPAANVKHGAALNVPAGHP